MTQSYRFKSGKTYAKQILDEPSVCPSRITPSQFLSGGKNFTASLTGKGVRVCLIDSGIVDHKSIRISTMIANLGRSKNSRDVDGHAFVAAGLIGASDAHRCLGLAPNSIIGCAKATDDGGVATTDTITAGLIWALVAGFDIIVLSHAIDFSVGPIKIAVEKAAQCQAVIVAEDGEGEIPSHVLVPSTVPIHLPDTLLTSLYPDDRYVTVSAEDFKPAIIAGLVALVMEKGMAVSEGETRGKIVKSHLAFLLK